MGNEADYIGAVLLWLLGGMGLLMVGAAALSEWLKHRRWKRRISAYRRTTRWS